MIAQGKAKRSGATVGVALGYECNHYIVRAIRLAFPYSVTEDETRAGLISVSFTYHRVESCKLGRLFVVLQTQGCGRSLCSLTLALG